MTRCNLLAAIVVVAANVFIPAAAPAADLAPVPLRGKTVILDWSEIRLQRSADSQRPFNRVEAQMRIAIYFSEIGRAFGRVIPTVGGESGQHDVLVDEPASSSSWETTFSGGNLSLFQPFFNGGAIRRVEIAFSADFSSCSSRVEYAKREGVEIWRTRSAITHGWVDLQSDTAGAATCAVQVGNVFAN